MKGFLISCLGLISQLEHEKFGRHRSAIPANVAT
jgi:hypothetical protein